MSEALKTQTAAENQHSPEMIAGAFDTARNELYALTVDEGFLEMCQRRGIDPYDDMTGPNARAYWTAITDRASIIARAEREENGDSPELSAFELLAATPQHVYNQMALDHLPRGDRPEALRIAVCRYNNLMQDFAVKYSDVRKSTVENALVTIATAATDTESERQAATIEIQKVISGVRNEVGFSQLVKAAGREEYETTLSDDLRGIDKRVASHIPAIRTLNIDVKSTLKEAMGPEAYKNNDQAVTPSPYRIKGRSRIVMFSLLAPHDFGDSFYAKKDVVAQKAPILEHYLQQAEQNLAAAA